MRILIVVLSITLNNFGNCQMKFSDWKKSFNKSYNTDVEDSNAKQAFDMNNAYTTLLNSLPTQRHKLGLNEFADTTFELFRSTSLGVVLPANLSDRGNKVTNHNPSPNPIVRLIQANGSTGNFTPATAPASVDYRSLSLAIKNQQRCGSCWAFAAIGTLESRMKMLNSSYNTTLSEQFLVDCDTRNFACNGGWPITALNWIVQSGGNSVPATSSYQYYGFKMSCRATPKIPMNIKATVQNYTAGNEDIMKQIVANVGPVSAVMSVTPSYQFYKSGIFFDSTCNSNCTSVNHAIIIVGYGTDPATNSDFWIIKNSWGTSWGQGGYAFMSRNNGNNCNIACYAMYAI